MAWRNSIYIVHKYAQIARITKLNPHDVRYRFGYRMVELVPLQWCLLPSRAAVRRGRQRRMEYVSPLVHYVGTRQEWVIAQCGTRAAGAAGSGSLALAPQQRLVQARIWNLLRARLATIRATACLRPSVTHKLPSNATMLIIPVLCPMWQ